MRPAKATAAEVIAALRRGASLHLCFRKGRAEWALSTGRPVSEAVAHAVVTRPDVIGADAGLLDDASPQTYRLRSPG